MVLDKSKCVFPLDFSNTPVLSPRRRLSFPACKPYGLEADPEAITPCIWCDLNAPVELMLVTNCRSYGFIIFVLR